MASATTPAAGTAVASLRWLIALAGSPVLVSMVSRARGTVEIGFIAALTRSGSPVLMPPSMPPARLVRRAMPFSVASISSCACEPRRVAVVKPSPTSTPFMAWLVAGSAQRTGSASMAALSSGPGMRSSGVFVAPMATTWLRISMPSTWLSRRRATSPRATRAAVSRALARSRTGRASVWPNFCMPARSACPGRGLVNGAFLARPASCSTSTGSADMTASHLGHSVLAILIATGPPSVRPCRTPAVSSTSSCSKLILAPRPYPARLRARAAARPSVVIRTPEGTPSQIATSARPCDSPAVSQRNMHLILWGQRCSLCDDDLDAAAQPGRQPGGDAGRGPVHRRPPAGLRRGPAQPGQVQRDGEVRPVVTARGQANAGDGRLGGHRRLDFGSYVGVFVRRGHRRSGGQRHQPGAVHGEWYRAAHVDDDRTPVADGAAPHPVRLGRHRAGVRPPPGQRVQASEGEHRGPSVPADQGGQHHLAVFVPLAVLVPLAVFVPLGGGAVSQDRDHRYQQPRRGQRGERRPLAALPGLVGGQRRGHHGTAARPDSGGLTRSYLTARAMLFAASGRLGASESSTLYT